MKNLSEYVNEKLNESNEESKDFTFNFTDMENADELIKSLEEQECCTIDDKKVTVKVEKGKDITTVQDIIQQTLQGYRKSSKGINDEQYAQKISKLEKTLGEMNDFIDELNVSEDDQKKNKEEE